MCQAVSSHACVHHQGYLYAIGGINSQNVQTVQYAAIDSDGSLKPWKTTQSLTTARSNCGAIVMANRIYVLGGSSGSSNASHSSIEYADIGPGGALSPWRILDGFTLPTSMQAFGVVAYPLSNNRYAVVVAGGMAGINDPSAGPIYQYFCLFAEISG
jgi:hypothetical protein